MTDLKHIWISQGGRTACASGRCGGHYFVAAIAADGEDQHEISTPLDHWVRVTVGDLHMAGRYDEPVECEGCARLTAKPFPTTLASLKARQEQG